ncbi:MAG: hypothetical protein E7640_04700 [Ruminococcaceae bacterium]|nr:hypothetical protein [Oscillospiraceae bacterium]
MKRRLSLVFAVMMIAVVFTVIFTAMALPTSAATEAGDSDVVATVYWHTADDFSAVPAENKATITKAEMLTKLLVDSNDNVTKAKAEAGNYVWVVFEADKQISLERNGGGIAFYVAKDKKTYVEGNGSVYRFNMDGDYDNGNAATFAIGVGTGTNPGQVIISDFTVNSKNDAAISPASCTVEFENVTLNSSRHKGINVTAGDVKVVFDGNSNVYGGQHTFNVYAPYTLEVTGKLLKPSNGYHNITGQAAAKVIFKDVTYDGGFSTGACLVEIDGGTYTAMEDAFNVQGTGALTIKGGANFTPTRFFLRLQAANCVVNIEDAVVKTTKDSFIRHENTTAATVNISGENTLLENTGTGCVINSDGKSNLTINMSGGTLKASKTVFYGNGGTGYKINITGGTIESTAGTDVVIKRLGPAADDELLIKNATVNGGLSVGGTVTIDNSTVNPGTSVNAITFSGTTLNITNGSTVTAAENKYTIRINSAATVTIDGGSVVSSASVGDRVSETKTAGHIFFGSNNITLNISGEGTVVEGTSTASINASAGAIIDINRKNGAKINISDGATLKSKNTTCIYNLGDASTTVDITISGEDTLIQAGENGDKPAILIRQEFATEGSITMTGGTVRGAIISAVNNIVDISITGGEIYGMLNFQQNNNTTEAIFKDITITTVLADGGSNTIDLANMPATFENCTINASGGCHAITARSTVNIKNTTITCTGATIAVRAFASSDVSSANITIDGDSALIGDARGGAWGDTGTIEIASGATVTIEAGAVVSAKSGNTIGVKTGGQVYSEGEISNETGMVLVLYGYAEFTGGSITTGTTALDIPAIIAEGGEFGAFENVEFTGKLKVAGGTLTADGANVTFTDGNPSLEEGDNIVISVATLSDASAKAIAINGSTVALDNVTVQALVIGGGADVTATNSIFASEVDGAIISVAGASTVTLNNTKVNNAGAGVAIAVADAEANEINLNNSELKANSTVIVAKNGENDQAATLNLNNVRIIANEGTPIEGEAALSFYVAAVKNPADEGAAAEGQVEIYGVVYNIYTGAQGGMMTTTDGAAVRLSARSNGLRFTSILSAKTVAYINSLATDPASVEFGTAVFPTHLIEAAGLTTFDVPALKALGHTIIEIPADETAMNDNKILGGDNGDEVVGYTIMANVTTIEDAQLGWEYSAITYIKYTDASGEHVIYGTYDEANNSRSMVYVATMAYNDLKAPEDEGYDSSYAYLADGGKYSPYTAEQRAVIKAIIDKYEALNPAN